MKKTAMHFMEKLVIVSGCLFIFLNSCGLEDYPYISNPTYIKQCVFEVTDTGEQTYNDDPSQKYFSFRTNEDSAGNTIYKGTDILYRIYNNYSVMNSNISAIDTYISNLNYSGAVESLKTRKYQSLGVSEGRLSPLIGNVSGKCVYIRLTDYLNNEDYRSGICIDQDSMVKYEDSKSLQVKDKNDNYVNVFPRRSIDSSLTFNFGGENFEHDKVPADGDEDVEFSSSPSEEKCWYVALYAVGVGLNTSEWKEVYSQPVYLGAQRIVEGEYN